MFFAIEGKKIILEIEDKKFLTLIKALVNRKLSKSDEKLINNFIEGASVIESVSNELKRYYEIDKRTEGLSEKEKEEVEEISDSKYLSRLILGLEEVVYNSTKRLLDNNPLLKELKLKNKGFKDLTEKSRKFLNEEARTIFVLLGFLSAFGSEK